MLTSRTTRKTGWLEIEKWHPSNPARNVVNNEGQVLSAVVGCSSLGTVGHNFDTVCTPRLYEQRVKSNNFMSVAVVNIQAVRGGNG